MITTISIKYSRPVAFVFLSIMSISTISPVFAGGTRLNQQTQRVVMPSFPQHITEKNRAVVKPSKKEHLPKVFNTSGPSQPEMSSFKSVNTDNMVNLFTGDFSYNIPLLDVGGYPVNIFYDGGVSMEQEASWVGLGWNINPGSINRNMRGVPDDFDGTDQLEQTQKIKPNVTFGVRVDADFEHIGIKGIFNVGGSLGLSFNNYLGPAVDFGFEGGANFRIADKVKSEKSGSMSDSLALKMGIKLGANLGSRTGLTLSPSVSLSATSFLSDRSISNGINLSTSYNSRYGIKEMQIGDQMSFNKSSIKKGDPVSGGVGQGLASTTISFAKPSYMPAIRMPMTNTAVSGRFQLGSGILGQYASGAAEVYKQKSEIADNDIVQTKPLVGYIYYEKAQDNPNAVMDFTRLNDREVTPNTPIISAPQYTYDVFSVQGEGTGGSFRAYRNDIGYVRDNYSKSKDKNDAAGVDIGPPGHYGVNLNLVETPTTIGDWTSGNNLRLNDNTSFKAGSGAQEGVYLRNPGENSVLNSSQFNKIGGTSLVRFKLGGTNSNPSVNPTLEQVSPAGTVSGTVNMNVANVAERKKRSQVISFLTASEASLIGLDKKIKSYNNITFLDASNNLKFDEFNRVDAIPGIIVRKANHISQVNITEGNGKRYVYGIPVYNTAQTDFTFTVSGDEIAAEPGRVAISAAEPTLSSPHLAKDANNIDGYFQKTKTPSYAHSFLLSGLLSPDYVDVTGNGITEDDLGTAVKFNYTRIQKPDGSPVLYKWRSPEKNLQANFNTGTYTEAKDNKGLISYGERESWYMHSIESKTMIALFTLQTRKDAKGVLGDEQGGKDVNDTALRCLKKIDLYSKADLKKNGITGAKPIKTVNFEYDYTLCKKTPDNIYADSGKLTLKKIWFTFNGQGKRSNPYVFNYGTTTTDNPDYLPGQADRWGSYKPATGNPSGMKNADYSYATQSKTVADQNAGAWMLKKILLPSGGQMEVTYESDDYAFVQNKRAAAMMSIAGFGTTNSSYNNNLYDVAGINGETEKNFIFINIPEALQTTDKKEIQQKYLAGIDQLACKLAVYMPDKRLNNGIEYVTCYANIKDWGMSGTAYDKRIWIEMAQVNGVSPLSLTAVEYLREQLPGQAFPGYDVSEGTTMKQLGDMAAGLFARTSFDDPFSAIRGMGNAKSVNVSQSFARLTDPDGYKYGGGYRVASVKLKDNLNAMTGQYTSTYGQQYNYQTTEVFNGVTRTISSGVAQYEPGIGGEENPFQNILQIKDKLPLGPTSFGAIEMPLLDAFFPAPVVGYSKVTVRSINNNVGKTAQQKIRSGIGKQVTEFYTAKDYPAYTAYTSLDPTSDLEAHTANSSLYFYKYAFDSRTLSQGFLVATNNMHGKTKSQASYPENDEETPINYTRYFYRNTGEKGMDEKFDFAYGSQGGVVNEGNMGIDIELMNDLREFTVKSNSKEIQGQAEFFGFPIFPWIPFIWPVGGNSEEVYRAVTTTKVINYHSIVDSVVVMDKGSQVATKNLIYDAETGDVLVTRTNNEFDLPIYNTSYPAWWAYRGMGPSYKNIDVSNLITSSAATPVKINMGRLVPSAFDPTIFESGDELYIQPGSTVPSDICAARLESHDAARVWVYDINKTQESLTTIPDLVFLDSAGNLLNRDNVIFSIVRSGKRNMLDAQLASVTTMSDPVILTSGVRRLSVINPASTANKIINASAVEFKEKWQTDNGVIRNLSTIYDNQNCTSTENDDCAGYLEKHINPYVKGLVGNFKTWRNMVFYDSRVEKIPSTNTNLPQNGFIDNFNLYWNFDASNRLLPNITSNQWVWNSQLTRSNARGMELETKDALGIYTAAQYGFKKSMPVAITNNAQYSEAANESFEDDSYAESLNPGYINPCFQKHIDFTNMTAGLPTTICDSINAVAAVFPPPYADAPKTIVRKYDANGCDTSHWDVNYGGIYNTVPLSPLIHNGVFSPLANDSTHGTCINIEERDTVCIANGFTMEARFKVPKVGYSGEPAWSPYSFWFSLNSDLETIDIALVQNPGGDNRLHIKGLVFPLPSAFINYVTLKVQVTATQYVIYYNGLFLGAAPHGAMQYMKTVYFVPLTPSFTLDYMKYYNGVGDVIFQEDFNDCSQMAYVTQSGCASDCNTAFTNLFNSTYNTNYNTATLNSKSLAACGHGLTVCTTGSTASSATGGIVKAQNEGFKAHSGKNILKITAVSNLFKTISCVSNNSNFALSSPTKTDSYLYEKGANLTVAGSASDPTTGSTNSTSFQILSSYVRTSNPGTAGYSGNLTSYNVFENSGFGFKGNYIHNTYASIYVEITNPGNYQFSYGSQGISPCSDIIPRVADIDVNIISITNSDLVQINYGTKYPGFGSQTQNFTVCFQKKGIYQINMHGYNYFHGKSTCNLQASANANTGPIDWYYLNLENHPEVLCYKSLSAALGCTYNTAIAATADMLNPIFTVPVGKQMLFSTWVHEQCGDAATGTPCKATTFSNNSIELTYSNNTTPVVLKPSGPIIEGWQRYEATFTAPAGATSMTMKFVNTGNTPIYFDDIRLHPFNANMKSYVYDPVSLRLSAELDANNYARFYEYDEEGTLIRTKAETKEGIKTITETRSATQKTIQTLQ